MIIKYKAGDYIALFVIVDRHKASGVLEFMKKLGVTGGTILQGYGTVKSGLLSFLELNEDKKEILMMIVNKKLEDMLIDKLLEKYKLHKKNHGIAFSIDVYRMLGSHIERVSGDMDNTNREIKYEAVFVIVENGKGDFVVEAAQKAGAKGATIVHGRGSGIHETDNIFGLVIEPEKEIVIMLIKREDVDRVTKSVREAIDIEKPGQGIMFIIDVNRTAGILD
ncbi:P-II family nitrogen regulator [Microaceticoccus formicicus]|uniref:P-II family nitrogen regulator n=1 Tax=Microaceticoccus formicicus TaxID=3118105 RepID=UPI003CCFF684|nr:P-II family nitrogen regulator [Peptoniphilaceae bacterium AMB_02]